MKNRILINHEKEKMMSKYPKLSREHKLWIRSESWTGSELKSHLDGWSKSLPKINSKSTKNNFNKKVKSNNKKADRLLTNSGKNKKKK